MTQHVYVFVCFLAASAAETQNDIPRLWRSALEVTEMMDRVTVRESANKSTASAASPDYVKFQAVIKSAASAASLRGGRASGRLDYGFFLQFLVALAAKK